MKTIKVGELMVPLDEYTRLDENKTLYDALMALSNLQEEQGTGIHTSILVVNQEGDIITLLTMLDMFRLMEPKYKEVEAIDLSRFGMQPGYVESMLESFDLWANPLEDFCHKTSHVFLKNIQRETLPQDTVLVDATLDMAVHRMIVSNKHSLLVKHNDTFVGVLRSFDVFATFCKTIGECTPPKDS